MSHSASYLLLIILIINKEGLTIIDHSCIDKHRTYYLPSLKLRGNSKYILIKRTDLNDNAIYCMTL
jgi:hypothetical protein